MNRTKSLKNGQYSKNGQLFIMSIMTGGHFLSIKTVGVMEINTKYKHRTI